MASPVDLVGVVTVGVASLADGGAASLADAGVASPADLAGIVTVGVASLAYGGAASLADAGAASPADLARAVTVDAAAPAVAGVASLADAGVASLAAAGCVDGVMRKLPVPICARTGEITLQQEYVVRDCLAVDGSVSGDCQMGCGDCVSATTWCQGTLGVCDKSGWQCVAYVSYDPDCGDHPVTKDDDGNPFRTMTVLAEPFCVVTDYMTYQERIEALSGTIYDYDDVLDNTPDYFDYDDHRDYEEWCGWNYLADDNSLGYFDNSNPHGCEEWYGWDGRGTDGLWCDPYLSDVADGELFLSWKPGLTVADVPDRSLPIMPDIDGKPEVSLYGSWESILGAVQFSCTDIPIPDLKL